MRRDTLHIALESAVTKTASYAPLARDCNLDRFNELVVTLNITAAERTTTQTYDFYLITGDGFSEWDLVHFPQIAVAGAARITARVLSSLLPQTVTPAAPGVAAIAPSIINTAGGNAPKTLGAGLVAHGPWGNYLRYELVCGGTITTGITYTLQVEAAWSRRSASSGSGGSVNFDFTTGVLPAAITFTRPSIGTYNSSGNLLVTAGNDVARFNYVSGVANLLIEGSATNVLPQSNDFATAPWALAGAATVTGSQFVSPDGTNNGWTLGGISGGVYQFFTFANIPYTVSVWGKRISGVDSNPQLKIGTFPSGALVAWNPVLTRIAFTATPVASSDATQLQLLGTTGTHGIYGAQLETGSKMTSYIPTTTVPVTRAADSATFTIPAGVSQLTYTFDDNSTQTVAVSPGSYTIPVTLNRPNIKKIIGS